MPRRVAPAAALVKVSVKGPLITLLYQNDLETMVMRFRYLVFGSVFALMTSGVTAQSMPMPLDLDGLSDCAARSFAAQQRADTRIGRLSRLLTERAAVMRETAALEAERTGIDRRDASQVAQFNARVARACADYAAYVAAYNEAIAVRNTYAAAFNADCANRDFDPAMVASLSVGLQAAWQAATSGGEEVAMLGTGALPAMPQPFSN